MPVSFLLTAAALAFLAEPTTLAPVSARSFHVAPDQAVRLDWKSIGGDEPSLEYLVRDYMGAEEARGKAVKVDGVVRVERSFRQGYHELEFPATSQRFGVLALPRPAGNPDPFFAMDAAMSWLVRDDQTRDELIAFARGVGVSMIRERMTWNAIQTARDRWDWESGSRFERLRKSYRAAGIPVLEMGHDAPRWAGRVGKYSQELVATADSWRTIGERWGRYWGGVEIWNEPDISFGGDMPGDQYASYAKAVAYGLRRADTPVPIVGGVTARFAPTFLDNCTSSDLIRRVDAFSFHDYGPSLAFEDLIAQYREWLRASGSADLPLWVTECGWPWNRGPDRPPADQDRASAVHIAMKAVEARACGVERFFTFVYPFYEENAKNFSVMDRRATPLRCMAVYAQTISALKGLRYLGDLRCDDPRIARARVFGDDVHAVVVLYSAMSEVEFRKQGPIRLAAASRRVEGADGREVAVRGGQFEMADGLAFAWFDSAALKNLVDVNTRAKSLQPGLHKPKFARAEPIILRLRFDSALVSTNSNGYHLKEPVQTLPVVVEAINLGESEETLDLAVTVGRQQIEGVRKVSIRPRSQAATRWDVPISGRFGDFEPLQIRVEASGTSGVRDRLAFTLRGEPSFEEAVSRLKSKERLPIEDLTRWTANIGAGGEMNMEAAKASGWRLLTRHKPTTDRWVYPIYRLPASVDLSDAKGLLVRARCRSNAQVRVFLWEGETGVAYLNGTSLITTDNRWHVARLDFRELERSHANAVDANGKLDLKAVRKISIGVNDQVDANELEISDVFVIR